MFGIAKNQVQGEYTINLGAVNEMDDGFTPEELRGFARDLRSLVKKNERPTNFTPYGNMTTATYGISAEALEWAASFVENAANPDSNQ